MERAVEEVGRIFGDVGLGQFHILLVRLDQYHVRVLSANYRLSLAAPEIPPPLPR